MLFSESESNKNWTVAKDRNSQIKKTYHEICYDGALQSQTHVKCETCEHFVKETNKNNFTEAFEHVKIRLTFGLFVVYWWNETCGMPFNGNKKFTVELCALHTTKLGTMFTRAWAQHNALHSPDIMPGLCVFVPLLRRNFASISLFFEHEPRTPCNLICNVN